MSLQIDPKAAALIDGAVYMWFTTVREDGMPQPTPVWFSKDGDSYLIYSNEGAQKVKNLRASSKIALSYSSDDEAGNYVVIMGHASVDPNAPKPSENAAYMAKYRDEIPKIGMTIAQFDARFNLPIRVLPTRVRGE